MIERVISEKLMTKFCFDVFHAGFELEFKTRDSNGLLVFLASQGRQEEYVALQLKSGRPWFVFDTQGRKDSMNNY